MRGASPGLPAPRTQHDQEQMTFLQPPAVRASAFRSEPAGADRSLWGSVLGLLTSGLGWGDSRTLGLSLVWLLFRADLRCLGCARG